MNGVAAAWFLAIVSTLLAGMGIWVLTGRLGRGFLRSWLLCLIVALALMPSPVPGFEGSWAPAYVVALFEALFQLDGEPLQALKLLLAAGLTAISAAAVWSWLDHRLR